MHMSDRNSTRTDLSAIIEGLILADVKFILVGGIAAVVKGAPVTTMDVDIVHNRSSENISKLVSFLKSTDAIYRRPDNKIIKPEEKDFLEMGHFLFSTRLGPIDVLAFIEQGQTYEDILDDTVQIEFRGHTIHVLDIRKMIELKKNSSDLKDKLRLPILEETFQQLMSQSTSG